MENSKKKEFNSRINELLSKFENGLELYRNNPIFASCIEHLLRGGDLYKILEEIIVMQSSTQEKLTELINSGVLRQEIIVSQEICEKLKQSCFINSSISANGPFCNKNGTGTYCSKCGDIRECKE